MSKAVTTYLIVIYVRILADYCTQKIPHQSINHSWGNIIEYLKELTTRTMDLITVKIVWNRVLGSTDAKYMYIDIKNIYLATPMDRFEYMKIPVKLIQQKFMDAWNLHDKIRNGFIYIHIKQRMYDLLQAGILANKLLCKRPEQYEY